MTATGKAMAAGAGRRIALALALDAVLWYLAPAAFLCLYVTRFLAPPEAIGAHLRVVALPLLAVWLVRLALGMSLRRFGTARLALSFVGAALIGLLLAYYALVLTGLDAWGQVVSWQLITSYGGQAFELADALGISAPLAVAAVAAAYLALCAAVYLYLRRFDWMPWVAELRSPRWLPGLALLAGVALFNIELYSFVVAAPYEAREPFSLTRHPGEASWTFQGHAVDRVRAARLDAAEEAARAAYRPAGAGQHANLILIVVDALRPDHMGVYGYGRDTTPNLSRLGRRGALRKAGAMYAACSASFCGLLSLASSKFLHEFSERPMTLQEALRLNGYRIHLLLGGNHTLFYGLHRIYGKVDSYFDAGEGRSFRYMNDDRLVLERLSAFPSWDGSPAMLQFHLMSAHPLGNRDAALARYAPASNYALGVGRSARDEPSEQTVNFYDNGVLQADATIQGILERLERKGYLRQAVVAITADHGEGLGEHGFFLHGNSVHEEAVRVPFLLISYGRPPHGSIAPRLAASQVDIAPTLLAELGIPQPATWSGMALQHPRARSVLYFQERWQFGLLDIADPATTWKYWFDGRTGREYAFNLTADPGERTNALASAPAQRRREWRLKALATASVGAVRAPEDDARRIAP